VFDSARSFFRDDGHAPARRDLQRERQPRDAAAKDEKIELFHRDWEN
jgi:hypothetical protein